MAALMAGIGRAARAAAAELAFAAPEAKRAALEAAADAVWAGREAIIAANAEDLAFGRDKGLSPAMMDRLMLDEARIGGIVAGLRSVAAQADPTLARRETRPAGPVGPPPRRAPPRPGRRGPRRSTPGLGPRTSAARGKAAPR